MRPDLRLALLFALAPVACNSESKPKDSAESADAAGSPESAEAATGPSAVTLPTVTVSDADPRPDDTVTVWIAPDGLWVGRDPASAISVAPLTDARLPADASELIEPLANALFEQPGPTDRVLVLLGGGPRSEALQIVADARTNAATLRRVLTAARAVGYGPMHYAISDEDSIELAAEWPVAEREQFDTPLVVGHKSDGALLLNARPMKPAELRKELQRHLEYRDRKCVRLDADDDVDYTAWLQRAVWLRELGVDCVTVPSPIVPVDAIAPPPPPPPPAGADDGSAPPPPAAAPTPPEQALVAAWWSKATAAAARRRHEHCSTTLDEVRKRFESTETPDGSQYTGLAQLEEECGDKERARALPVERTEKYPDDPKAWLALGIVEFDPLWPDPKLGKPFAADVPAAERREIAARAIAAFEKAAELSPKDREPHTWAAMAYTQLAFAQEKVVSVEKMEAENDAWRHRNALCELDGLPACPEVPVGAPPPVGGGCCPPAPYSEAEIAAVAKGKPGK